MNFARHSAWQNKSIIDDFHIRGFLQFTASNFKDSGLDKSVELLIANECEDQGQYWKRDYNRGEVKLLRSKVPSIVTWKRM